MKTPIWLLAAVFLTGAAFGWLLKPAREANGGNTGNGQIPGGAPGAIAAMGPGKAGPEVTPELPDADEEREVRALATPQRVMGLAEIEALPAARDRERAAAVALKDYASRKDFEGLLRFLEGMKPGVARERAMASWIREWAMEDADAAIAWAESLSDPRLRRAALKETVMALGRAHPMRAIALADGLPPGDRQNALLNVGVQWAQNDPVAAANYFAAAGEAFHVDHTLMHILSHWAGRDPEAAKAWSLSRANEPIGGKLAGRMISALGNHEPEMLADFYRGLPEQVRTQVAADYAGALARGRPLEAIRFAQGLADERARNDAVSRALGVWTNDDPAEAAKWLGGIPNGAERDRLVTQFAHGVVRYEPESAADWAASIGDAGTRRSTLASIVEMWKRDDADGAWEWVAQRRGLTEEERKDLQARLGRGD